MKAVYSNDFNLIESLLTKNIDANSHTAEGDTPLMAAIRGQYEESVRVLLENGASPNFPDDSGWYPLHFAVQSKNMKIIKLLINYGAKIDQQDGQFGNTPLFVAIKKTEGREFIDFFLNLGADVNIPNKRGVTALDVANRKKISL